MKKRLLIGTLLVAATGAAAFFALNPKGQSSTALKNEEATGPAIGLETPKTAAKSSGQAEATAKQTNKGKRLNASEKLALTLSENQRERLLGLLNEGSARDLAKIHGIGETRGEAIVKARPFAAVTELTNVDGVGKITFARVIEYAATELAKDSGLAAVDVRVTAKR